MASRIKPKIDVVTVGSTSKTLAALLTEALRASTKQVTLRPHATGIYQDDGTASANSDPLGTSPVLWNGGPEELAALEFYAAADTKMSVIQEG
jgi:hypothetical protein